ncbi:MAG TPA: hypothetical protein PKM17_04255 [Syntrophorhabdus sp.]|nr:hypothetical protein [Syntrophorhabdus sp.]
MSNGISRYWVQSQKLRARLWRGVGSVTRVRAGTFGSDASGHRFRQRVPKVARRVVKLCTGNPSEVSFTVFFLVAEGDTSAGLTGSLVSPRRGSSSVIV